LSLYFYNNTPFTVASQLGPVDTYIGDGTTVTFTLTQKTASQLSSLVQFGSIQYSEYNGGFTRNLSNNTFTVSPAPATGSQGVAPALISLGAAVFDQSTVNGVSNPTVQEVPFWLIDSTTIHLNKYTSYPGEAGIAISITDLISSSGAQTSFCQLACSDANGNALTYQATGTVLYTDSILAFGSISASSNSGASSILTSTAMSQPYYAGDYIIVNIGNATQEIMQISAKSSSGGGTLTVPGLTNFPHYAGESIFVCGRKFWLKVTCPVNIANNQATSYIDLGLKRRGIIRGRP